jgi:AcrR family transcriptional regulator
MPARKSFVMASSRERVREAAKSLFAEHGYEATSTAEICRLAGTSQSQLIKLFVNKQGLLEAIFEYAWEQINPAMRLAVEATSSPRDRLNIVVEMMLTFMSKDKELRTLFLLEGRRIRGDGQMVVLVPGFLEFVKMLDGILKELAAAGELRPEMNLQAFRSGLIGALEGILRDQLLARPSHFPANYSESEAHATYRAFLSACLIK